MRVYIKPVTEYTIVRHFGALCSSPYADPQDQGGGGGTNSGQNLAPQRKVF